MIALVSNNEDLAVVERLEWKRVGLNDVEVDAILGDFDENRIIPVNGSYRPYVLGTKELDETERPTLRRYARGPFTLAVSNQGSSLDRSMLSFELEHIRDPIEDNPDVQKTESGIVITQRMNIVSMSIAAIPFVDIFGREVLKEAERSEKLLKAARTQSFEDARARRDTDTVRTMSRNFMASVRPDLFAEEYGTTKTVGKEAVCDNLAGSLEASAGFYDTLWQDMVTFFEPAIRYLGEEYALGHTDLRSPKLIT